MSASMDQPTINIVPATIAHLPLITPLFLAYSAFYGRTVAPEAASDYLRDGLTLGESVIFLALQQDSAGPEGGLGFLQMHPSRSSKALGRRWIVNDLYVIPAMRRHHIGRRLFVAAQTYAAESGAKDLRLMTKITNQAARAFYESLGWRSLDEFIAYEFPVE